MPADGARLVLVCAFDPVAELGNQSGILALPTELAGRLIAEHRVEAASAHSTEALRFVPGSSAFEAARQALRDARGLDSTPAAPAALRPARKVARLER
jgi:hypothetical protein